MILGIDPGVRYCGMALIEEGAGDCSSLLVSAGSLTLPDISEVGIEASLLTIKVYLDSFLGDHVKTRKGNCDVALEDYAVYGFSGAIIKAAQMGEVIRFIIEDLAARKFPRDRIYRYRGTDVRDYICGNRRAKDTQVRECLVEMGYTQRMNVHTRDALSVALFHASRKERQCNNGRDGPC